MSTLLLLLATSLALSSAQYTDGELGRSSNLAQRENEESNVLEELNISRTKQVNDEFEEYPSRNKRAYDLNDRLNKEQEGNVENVQVKRFISFFKTRPPKSEGYKRGPGFRSWGGKRADVGAFKREVEAPSSFERYEKRGKSLNGYKRRPFQSWGGKRNLLDDEVLYAMGLWRREAKRKFSSWGGKREYYGMFAEKSDGSRKKPSFRSWGGK